MFLAVAKLEADEALNSAKHACIASFCEAARMSAGDSLLLIESASQGLGSRKRDAVVRAKLLGYFAMVSFVLAYTLVFACVVRLWWLSR